MSADEKKSIVVARKSHLNDLSSSLFVEGTSSAKSTSSRARQEKESEKNSSLKNMSADEKKSIVVARKSHLNDLSSSLFVEGTGSSKKSTTSTAKKKQTAMQEKVDELKAALLKWDNRELLI
jgi:hypothetical protein